MRLPLIACLVAGTLAAPACAATRTFALPGFDRIRSSVPFDVTVHSGNRPGAVAIGAQAAIDRLEIGVRGGELVVATRRDNGWLSAWRGRQRLSIEVTVPAIHTAVLEGAGNLDIDRMAARDVGLGLSGPGNIRVGGVQAGVLTVSLSGPGTIDAGGRAGQTWIAASGPGDVRLARVATRDIEVRLSGPGNVAATASGKAHLILSGPGTIRVGGHPRCAIEKSGPGDVRCG